MMSADSGAKESISAKPEFTASDNSGCGCDASKVSTRRRDPVMALIKMFYLRTRS